MANLLIGRKKLTCDLGAKVTRLTVPTESESNVSALADEGCVFIESSPMTFDDARTFCKDAGGDMYAGGNFASLQEYFSTAGYQGKF